MPTLTRTDEGAGLTSNQLPGDRYKHAVWHQLLANEVKGDQLKCPRIRKGPDEGDTSDSSSSSGEDDDEEKVKSTRIKRKQKNKKMENWSKSQVANFSYQDLGHDYQMQNLCRILKSLKRCEELHLADDSLTNLSNISLPKSLQMLNLRKNYFNNFRDLPKCPKLKHLNLMENNVTSLDGSSRFGGLLSLDLRRNPIQFEMGYRQLVLKRFRNLEMLDGNPVDYADDISRGQGSSVCVIS